MRKIRLVALFISACVLLAIPTVHASGNELGGMKLIEGYALHRSSAVDAGAWVIENKSGSRIEFEAGPNEGSWANPAKRSDYVWFRERTLNHYVVRFALTKPGVRSVWDAGADTHPGNILLVSFLLGGYQSGHTANFKSKINNPSELGDALLMITTFDPNKDAF